jgi:hypothetical protein
MVLTPHEDGSTAVESEPTHFPVGTLIEIVFGPEIPDDDRTGNGVLRARCRRSGDHDLSNPAGGNSSAAATQDRDYQPGT